jgi:FMN phosphatase YigB (HAD superfamily)
VFKIAISKLGLAYFRIVFFLFLLGSKREKVAVFDLDNTLFDTWPLRLKYNDDKAVYSRVEPFKGVLDLISKRKFMGYKILFITARQYQYYPITIASIHRYLSDVRYTSILVVPSAKDKFFFIERLVKKFKEVELYDDFSYNHERGTVKLYDEVIAKVKSMRIKYFGIDFLKTLQRNDSSHN